jgi:cytidylate kinase
LNYLYIDTGAMYRALTLKALQLHIEPADTGRVSQMARETDIDLLNRRDGSLQVLLDGKDVTQDLRQPVITKYVSDIAKIKEVRQIMVQAQRRLGLARDSILDGRDIGTVVFPNAEKKFYLDADLFERAGRRHKELLEAGQQLSPEDVQKDMSDRDTIDSTREHAPLRRADDAVYIDTTKMTVEEVVAAVLKEITMLKHTKKQENK